MLWMVAESPFPRKGTRCRSASSATETSSGLTEDTPVIEAAALMRQHHVGDVIVVEEVHGHRKPVGIVTDRDLVVEVMASGLDPCQLKVGDLVSRPVVTID